MVPHSPAYKKQERLPSDFQNGDNLLQLDEFDKTSGVWSQSNSKRFTSTLDSGV